MKRPSKISLDAGPVARDQTHGEKVLPTGINAVMAVFKGELTLKDIGAAATIPAETPGLIALFLGEWDRNCPVYVLNPSCKGSVHPALLIRYEQATWKVQPWFLTSPDIQRSTRVQVEEAWLRVLLGLVTVELEPYLPDPTTAYSFGLVNGPNNSVISDQPPIEMAMIRINEFMSGGYQSFLLEPRAQRKWFIASRWKTWASGNYSLAKAASEVATEEGMKAYPADNLRNMCREMGLIWPRRGTW